MHKKSIKIRNLLALILISTSMFFTGCSSSNDVSNTNTKTNLEKSSSTVVDSQQSNSEQISDSSNSNELITETNKAEIHFINTGNSDAILIKEGDNFTLIDGGDNDDEGLMVNYLKKQGVDKIKYLVSTHAHADHLGGLDAVVKNFKVENAFVSNGSAETKSYRDFINALANKGVSPSVPLENNKFYLGKSYFEVLNTNGGNTTNDQSLVLLFTNGNDKILFTGDAEAETEKEILPKLCDVDVLKVGHHGSRSSSSDAFLKKIKPEYAVIQVGSGNSYGHPHKETISKFEKLGIEVHRNDECSNIIFTSTGNGVSTNCKKGSYTPGKRDNSSSNNISNNSNYKNNNYETEAKSNNDKQTNNETVYYTPKGKSYHSSRDCSALSRSKTILSGTIEQSNKYDPCDRCYGK